MQTKESRAHGAAGCSSKNIGECRTEKGFTPSDTEKDTPFDDEQQRQRANVDSDPSPDDDAEDGAETGGETNAKEPTATDSEIYGAFIAAGKLTDADRRELHKKRGLSDATIDACQFRSGGDVARDALETLGGKFPDDDLLESGLFEISKDPSKIEPYEPLCRKGIVIPYLNESGEVVHLKRHKFGGLAGKPVHLYCPTFAPSNPKDTRLIVVEGEFGAAALWQLGFWAIGVPGISSFVGLEPDAKGNGGHFPRFAEWLVSHGVKEVVFCFDAESKSDPSAPNFKEDVFNRYDTTYFAWRMGVQIGRVRDHNNNLAGITAQIATLPILWDKDGRKVDCDFALAAGKTRADFEAVFSRAVPPERYLASPELRELIGETGLCVLSAKIAHYVMDDAKRQNERLEYYQIRFPRETPEHLTGSVTFVQPIYRVNRDGDVRLPDGTLPVKLVPIADAPIWVSGRATSLEDGQSFLDIAFCSPDDSAPRSVLIPRDDAMDSYKLKGLAANGAPPNSANAVALVKYLSTLEARIARFIPSELLTTRNGWHAVPPNGERVFVLGNESIGAKEDAPKLRLKAGDSESEHIADALRPSGNAGKWRTCFSRVRRSSPIARVVLAGAFAPPLLNLVGVRSFGIHVFGESGGGKSAILKLAASCWGDPDFLMATLWTTPVAAEHRSHFLSDIPLCLDELQSNPDPTTRKMLNYILSGEKGKGRGAKSGGVRDTLTWRNVRLTNGEEALNLDNDMGGESARTLEFRGVPIPDADLARETHHVVRDNFGFAARVYLEKVLAADPNALKAEHRAFVAELSKRCENVRPAVLDALALVAVADGMLPSDELPDIVEVICELWAAQDHLQAYAGRALDWVKQWMVANLEHFENSGTFGDIAPTFGRIADGERILVPSEFEPALTRAGFNPRRVLGDWGEKGWLVTEGRNLRVKRNVGGQSIRAIVLRPEAFADDANG